MISPVAALTETVPFAGVPRTDTEAGSRLRPKSPTLSLLNVFNTTALSILVTAKSVLATGPLLLAIGSRTVMVNFSNGQAVFTLAGQVGTRNS